MTYSGPSSFGNLTSCCSVVLNEHVITLLILVTPTFNYRTIPNAEHSCTGHFISIYFDIVSFYFTILLVSCVFMNVVVVFVVVFAVIIVTITIIVVVVIVILQFSSYSLSLLIHFRPINIVNHCVFHLA